MGTDDLSTPTGITSITRQGGKVVAGSYSMGTQDSVFMGREDKEYRDFAGLVNLLTGKMPSLKQVEGFKCSKPGESPALNGFQGAARKYTVACSTYPIYGAWMSTYTVY